MAIDGRINVDVLFHDTDGTTSLKVVSLEDSTAYTTGKVAVITGTAGTTDVTFSSLGQTTYRNAAGTLVSFSSVRRVAFRWSGASQATLSDDSDNVFLLRSQAGNIAMSDATAFIVAPRVSNGTGTGTYTIVLWGDS